MRKFLLSFLMLFATATVALADEITIDPDGTGVTWTAATDETYGAGFKTTTNGLVVGLYKGGYNSTMVQPTDLIKVYKNAVLVIEASDGSNITGVTITASESKYSLNMSVVGTDEVATKNGTIISWTGSQKPLILQASNGQVRIKEVIVETKKDGSLSAPKFSVAGGTYYEKQTVTITNPNTTGKVYYTLDESDPTAESTEYTAPIEIAETKTLKAIAIDGEKKSAVTSATYTIKEMPNVASISEFLQLSKGDKAKFTNSIVVAAVYKKGNSVSYYCTDETGGIQLYDATGKIQEYNAKDVIPAGFIAEYDLYNSTPEAINITGLTAATEQKEAPYTVITAEEISTDMVGSAVQIKNAEISEISGSNFKVGDATGTVAAYNKFSLDKVEAYKNIVVTGIVGIYNNAVQVMPYDINYEGGTSGVTEVEDADKVEVIPGNGEIIVNGAGDVKVYDVEGRRTTTVKGSGEYPPKKKTHVIEAESGVYIVVADGEVVKVKVD